jgi:hypothetical protein
MDKLDIIIGRVALAVNIAAKATPAIHNTVMFL